MLVANFIVELPFGRRGKWGKKVSGWVDSIIGNWTISGILSARSGLPTSAGGPASSLSYFRTSSAIISGDLSAFKRNIHNVGTSIQYFADPVAANSALRFPRHGEYGGRNVLRGPSFWGLDLRVTKRFVMPWAEGHHLSVMVDAFNATNTNAFGLPILSKDSPSFGLLTTSSNAPRELQFGLRYDW